MAASRSLCLSNQIRQKSEQPARKKDIVEMNESTSPAAAYLVLPKHADPWATSGGDSDQAIRSLWWSNIMYITFLRPILRTLLSFFLSSPLVVPFGLLYPADHRRNRNISWLLTTVEVY